MKTGRLVFALALSALAATGVKASEVGNIFGTDGEAAEASRQASALAIEAILAAFEGLRQRELGTNDGAESFDVSGDLFRQASDEMAAVVEAFDLDVEIPLRVRALLAGPAALIQEQYGLPSPRTMGELYANLSVLTARIAVALEDVAAEETSAFIQFAPEIRHFLLYAELVTRAAVLLQ